MAQQTAMQQLIKWMEDMSEVIPFDQGSCYDKAIELLQMEKEQLENARPQIISNCVIKEMSNEEIWNASIKYDNGAMLETPMVHFQQGAFWYREQLKNSVHGT
jgi:hypothetical protein